MRIFGIVRGSTNKVIAAENQQTATCNELAHHLPSTDGRHDSFAMEATPAVLGDGGRSPT